MLEKLKVSAVQMAPQKLDKRPENMDSILSTIRSEARSGSQLVVFPEVSISGFFLHEAGSLKTYWNQGAIDVDGPEIQTVCEAVKAAGVFTIVGFAEREWRTGKLFNSVALIGPEGIVGIARKKYLPGLEKLYFTPGDTPEAFDCDLGRIGIAVCYDAMFPEHIGALSRDGADIIVFSSSMWRGGVKGGVGLEETKKNFWSVLPMVTAIQYQAFVISCNGSGSEYMGALAGTWERLGLSQIAAPTGDVLQTANGDSVPETISATLDRETLVEARTSYRFIADRAVA